MFTLVKAIRFIRTENYLKHVFYLLLFLCLIRNLTTKKIGNTDTTKKIGNTDTTKKIGNTDTSKKIGNTDTTKR